MQGTSVKRVWSGLPRAPIKPVNLRSHTAPEKTSVETEHSILKTEKMELSLEIMEGRRVGGSKERRSVHSKIHSTTDFN